MGISQICAFQAPFIKALSFVAPTQNSNVHSLSSVFIVLGDCCRTVGNKVLNFFIDNSLHGPCMRFMALDD